MAWTYSNWATQSTVALRLAVLNQHIQEVSDAISNERAAEGFSEGSSSLQQMLDVLMKERIRLEGMPGAAGSNGGLSVAKLTRHRDVR